MIKLQNHKNNKAILQSQEQHNKKRKNISIFFKHKEKQEKKPKN